MTAITIQVSNEVAETFGVQELEKQINNLIAQVTLKLAAKEMLRDLKSIDLSKDPEWERARNAAWEKETGKETCRSSPFLSKTEWGFTKILIYKSPVFPPFLPASPFPSIFITWLVSTPEGMKTFIFSSAHILPSPLQTLQGFSGVLPSPLQSGQTTS